MLGESESRRWFLAWSLRVVYLCLGLSSARRRGLLVQLGTWGVIVGTFESRLRFLGRGLLVLLSRPHSCVDSRLLQRRALTVSVST